jgi:hypothetical protein
VTTNNQVAYACPQALSLILTLTLIFFKFLVAHVYACVDIYTQVGEALDPFYIFITTFGTLGKPAGWQQTLDTLEEQLRLLHPAPGHILPPGPAVAGMNAVEGHDGLIRYLDGHDTELIMPSAEAATSSNLYLRGVLSLNTRYSNAGQVIPAGAVQARIRSIQAQTAIDSADL